MAGLTTIIAPNVLENRENTEQQLTSLAIDDRYTIRTQLIYQFAHVLTSIYPEYPFSKYENNDVKVFLEGAIYNIALEKIGREVLRIAGLAILEKVDKKQISDWLFSTDGEFVILIYKKSTQDVFVLNNGLAHLPLYLYASDNKVVLSRDLRTIVKLEHLSDFDRLGIAQYFMFGNPAGTRTLFNNVIRLEPATLVRFNCKGFNYELIQINPLNFEEKLHNEIEL